MSNHPRRTISLRELIRKWAVRLREKHPRAPHAYIARQISRKKVRIGTVLDQDTIRRYIREAFANNNNLKSESRRDK